MINFKNSQSQSGQIAIVILLIMVVLLTVGLSLASRTTQELFLSQQESESARVFNAAEVGVSDALSQDFDLITGTVVLEDPQTVGDVSTTTSITPTNTLETQIVEGAAVHLNLEGYTGTNFTINWALETICNQDVTNPGAASLLVSLYYDDGGRAQVIHETYSPCLRNPDDEFFEVGTDPSGNYFRQAIVNLPTNPLFARIRAVYADTALSVSGTSGFPTQYYIIRSSATTDVGEESRTIEVGRTLSGAPSFMDYAVYSGNHITQDNAGPDVD
jgi:hypothetical protein